MFSIFFWYVVEKWCYWTYDIIALVLCVVGEGGGRHRDFSVLFLENTEGS
jgi:hypothetical protein